MAFYFKDFPYVEYKFGDEVEPVVFQKLSAYVDILDQVKSVHSFYSVYHIAQDERPDTLSYRLYGTVDYYWTFFLLNDHIRLSGWPLSISGLFALADTYYPHLSITTEEVIHSTFLVGTHVAGSQSGSMGTVIKRNINLGQLIIERDAGLDIDFINGEELFYFDEAEQVARSLTILKTTDQADATHHFETDGQVLDSDQAVSQIEVDIDPQDQSTINTLANITYRNHLNIRNEELKKIRVLKPDTIIRVAGEFRAALRA